LAFLIFTTLFAVVFAFGWYLSPLGVGFQDGPTNPGAKKIALAIYALSYFVGIPALLIGQVVSPVLWFYKHFKGAYIVPLVSISSFLLCVIAFSLVFTKF